MKYLILVVALVVLFFGAISFDISSGFIVGSLLLWTLLFGIFLKKDCVVPTWMFVIGLILWSVVALAFIFANEIVDHNRDTTSFEMEDGNMIRKHNQEKRGIANVLQETITCDEQSDCDEVASKDPDNDSYVCAQFTFGSLSGKFEDEFVCYNPQTISYNRQFDVNSYRQLK